MDRQRCREREKQSRCCHSAYKCLVCGIAKDNLENEQERQIFILEQTVTYLEEKLYNLTYENTNTNLEITNIK